MKKQSKEIENLNISMDKALHEEFTKFCKDMGQTKTGATEKAIRMYMDAMKKLFDVK